jgi:hypothetical protein
MKSPLLIALPIVLFIAAQAQAQLARQEFHALQSITLSDADFLNGKKDGVPVALAGVLRLPKLGPEKLPAAVLLQGSGGVGGSGSMIDEWTRELNEIGIATFAVDSFSGALCGSARCMVRRKSSTSQRTLLCIPRVT